MSGILRSGHADLAKVLEMAMSVESKTVEWKVFSMFDETSPKLKNGFAAIHEQERKHLEVIQMRIKDDKGKDSRTWVKKLLGICTPGKM